MPNLPHPHMPIHMDERLHRTFPGSPFLDMDLPDRIRYPRVTSTPFESRDGSDYLSAMASPMDLGSLASRYQRNPFPPGFESEAMMSSPEQYIDEKVRR